MCGIVGAVTKHNITKILLECLQRLEYRGYDSSGLAIINKNKQLMRLRCSGKVQKLMQMTKVSSLYGNNGIAHTRWATHGIPSENNAHPHISEHIAVVHNGIIENYKLLQKELQARGYFFNSETDTEVIAHLIHWEQKQGYSLREVILRTILQLRGTYSMAIINAHYHDTLLAVCLGSPIVIGLGVEGNFIASDQLALLPITRHFIFLKDGDIAEVTHNSVTIFDRFGKQVQRKNSRSNLKYNVYDKGTYLHYIQKEIYEQPSAIKSTLMGRIKHGKIDLSELGSDINELLSQVEYIKIIACGSSYNAGMVSRYWFESLAGIPCDVEIASEFRYRKSAVYSTNSLMITLSQSGETADTLAALRLLKDYSYFTSLAICNMAGSSLVRECNLTLITKAGIEIGVASTKTFTTQLTVLLMLAAKLAYLKDKNSDIEHEIVYELQILPKRIEQILSQDKHIKKLAKILSDKNHILFLGRGDQFPIAVEGALKLKEISYIHAEAYAAGELKHGPLALIDSNMPVIVLSPNNELLEKLKSNIEEVCARGGQVYILTDLDIRFNNSDVQITKMPCVERFIAPITYAVSLQLLAYNIGIIKGINVDQPRNLAKSVTVE